MYEILKTTRIIEENNRFAVFHLCEAFIYAIQHYIKNHSGLQVVYDWHAASLRDPQLENQFTIIRRTREKWSYGKDGTGDITKPENIRYFRDVCKTKDWIIGDCGGGADIKTLTYAQIAFILYNLREGGSCIFKCVITLLQNKIFCDMFYILYNNFETVQMIKPSQNHESQEVYIMCRKYRSISEKDKKSIVDFLHAPDWEKSLFNGYGSDFIHQLSMLARLAIESISRNYDRWFYFVDFGHLITKEQEDELMKSINAKDEEWILTHVGCTSHETVQAASEKE